MNAISAVKMDKIGFSVVSLTDEPDDKEYWQIKTPQERLQTIGLLRQLNYVKSQLPQSRKPPWIYPLRSVKLNDSA